MSYRASSAYLAFGAYLLCCALWLGRHQPDRPAKLPTVTIEVPDGPISPTSPRNPLMPEPRADESFEAYLVRAQQVTGFGFAVAEEALDLDPRSIWVDGQPIYGFAQAWSETARSRWVLRHETIVIAPPRPVPPPPAHDCGCPERLPSLAGLQWIAGLPDALLGRGWVRFSELSPAEQQRYRRSQDLDWPWGGLHLPQTRDESAGYEFCPSRDFGIAVRAADGRTFGALPSFDYSNDNGDDHLPASPRKAPIRPAAGPMVDLGGRRLWGLDSLLAALHELTGLTVEVDAVPSHRAYLIGVSLGDRDLLAAFADAVGLSAPAGASPAVVRPFSTDYGAARLRAIDELQRQGRYQDYLKARRSAREHLTCRTYPSGCPFPEAWFVERAEVPFADLSDQLQGWLQERIRTDLMRDPGLVKVDLSTATLWFQDQVWLSLYEGSGSAYVQFD